MTQQLQNFSQQKQEQGYDENALFLANGINRGKENQEEEDLHEIGDGQMLR